MSSPDGTPTMGVLLRPLEPGDAPVMAMLAGEVPAKMTSGSSGIRRMLSANTVSVGVVPVQAFLA